MHRLLAPFAALASPFEAVRRWLSPAREVPEASAAEEPSSPADGPAPPAPSPEGPPARLVARVAARSDTGRKRSHNEDRPLLQLLGGPRLEEEPDVAVDLTEDGLVMAVCDGMGGAVAGEVASALVVDTLSERTAEVPPDGLDPDGLQPRLVEGVEESNRRALDRVGEDPGLQGMGSTVTSAVLHGTAMVLAHVGDSRGYRLRGSELEQVTEDHSFVAKLVALGRITEEEARGHRQRNLLLQAVGTGGELEVERTVHGLRPGDRVLLCSDGLTTLVEDGEIREVLGGADGPGDQCETLVEMANARGGHDNITVVVAHLEAAGADAETVPVPTAAAEAGDG